MPVALAFVLAACFESGPLDFGGLTDSSAADTGGDTLTVETDSAADSAQPGDGAGDSAADTASDALDPVDTSDADVIAGDAADSVTVADTETVDGHTCVTDDDCARVPNDDLCAGPLRCIDETCAPDPAGAVVCTSDSACVVSRCEPATGLCTEDDVCSCDTPQTMLCGIAKSWYTSTLDALPSYTTYGCGPESSASPTMRLVSLPVNGRVRISGNDGVVGLHVMAGDVCDPVEACLAGGEDVLYFDAEQGARYTLAVEEIGPNQQVSVRADCDVKTETFCRDGLDDDDDGLSDCFDRDCDQVAGCELPPLVETGLCGDAIDNDVDGGTDCDDTDCDEDAGCLESCEVPTWGTYCNYSQGLDNGAGRSRATHYACNPVPQSAPEIVFPVVAGFTGRVRIGFSAADGLALHLLVDTGRGCTPKDCVEMATGDLFIDLVEGTTYYLVVDGQDAVVGNFFIAIDCEL